jgi:hypothetical protein
MRRHRSSEWSPGEGSVGDHQARVQLLGLRGEALVFGDELVPVEGVADRRGELLAQPGFGDEAEDFALVDRLHDRGQGEHGGDQDAGGVRPGFARLDQEIQPHHLGHAVVGDDHREIILPQQFESLERAGRGRHVVPVALKRLLEGTENDGLVVNNEDARGMLIA